MPERRSPTSSGRERWKPSERPCGQGAGAALQGAEPFGELAGARAEPFEAAGQPLGGALELADPLFELLAAGRDPVEAAVDEAGDVAQAFGFVAGGGDRAGQGPRCPAPGAGARDRCAPLRRVRWRGSRARSRLPPRIWGTSERRPSCRVRLPTAVLRCAWASFLEPSARRSIPSLACSPPGRGAFQAAGEEAGAFLGPAGALFEQGAARRALGEAAAQLGDGAGGVAQAGAERGEAADAVRPVGGQRLAPACAAAWCPWRPGRGRSRRGRRAGRRSAAASG